MTTYYYIAEARLLELAKKRVDYNAMFIDKREYDFYKNNNIKYLGDLIQFTKKEILAQPNIGKVTFKWLNERIRKLGLEFNTKITNWEEIRAELER